MPEIHSDELPSADARDGAHALHFWRFTTVANMNSGTDLQKGVVSLTGKETRVARLEEVGEEYAHYVLVNATGPIWRQLDAEEVAQIASGVPFTPDGDLTSTDVQAAVVELRDDTDTKLTGKADSSHVGAGGAAHAAATGAVAGFLSAADKTKLDTVETNAAADQVAGGVPFTADGDISATDVQAAVVEVRDDTDTKLGLKLDATHAGTGAAAHAEATVSVAGFMSAGDKAKLNAVEASAAADQTAAEVPFTPDGDIAATTVQAAIVEVRDDTDTKLTGKAAVSHASDHEQGGSDEIDGDHLAVSYVPSNYTRTTVPAEASHITHAAAHFAGIDAAIAGAGGGTDDQTATEVPFTPDGDLSSSNVQDVVVELRDDTDTKLTTKLDASHAGTGAAAHAAVTPSVAGFMSAADKTKLDAVETAATADQSAAEVAFAANGDITSSTVQDAIVEVRNDTDTKVAAKLDATHAGTGGATHLDATTSVAGFMSGADKTKLDAVETGATADQTAAEMSYDNTTSGLTATNVQAAIDEVEVIASAGGGGGDHGSLTGREDDDHLIYARTDGTRALTGDQSFGGNDITSVGLVDGRDVSADGAVLDLIEASATADQVAVEVPFTPDGDLASTNVQAAVVELRDDTDTKLTGKLDTSHAGTGATAHADVTTSVAGFMTAADKTKLNAVETAATADQSAAEVPFAADGDIAATTVQAAVIEVRDDTDTKLGLKLDATHAGTGATAHAEATTGVAGFMSAADKTKLDAVAPGAIASHSDAADLDADDHTHYARTDGTRVFTGPLNLQVAAAPAHSPGRLFYDQDEHALVIYNEATDVELLLGHDTFVRVYNPTGGTLTKGSVAYSVGVQSEGGLSRPTIGLARADDVATATVIGVLTMDIHATSYGYVTHAGDVTDIDTSSFAVNAPLYLSSTVAGALTATVPPAGSYFVQVGRAVDSAVSGKLSVDLNLVLETPIGIAGLSAHTGIISGGLLVNGGASNQYTIETGVGVFVDTVTDPEHPNPVIVRWDEIPNLVPTFLATNFVTEVALDVDGNVVTSAINWTRAQERTLIILGRVEHRDNATVTNTTSRVVRVPGSVLDIYDFIDVITPANLEGGHIITPNGANLMVDLSAGVSYRRGANYDTDPDIPNVVVGGAQTAPEIVYSYRDGSGGTSRSFETGVLPDFLDDGSGTPATVGVGRWTIARVFYFSSGTLSIAPGQFTYGSLSDAKQHLTTDFENTVLVDTLSEATLRCTLFVRAGATSLLDPEQASFQNAGALGVNAPQVASGGAGAAVFPLIENVTEKAVDVEITVSGPNIVATVTDEGGADFIRGIWDSTEVAFASGGTVNLAPGTATVPLRNFVYLTESGGVVTLAANTTGWVADSIHLAEVFVQTATEVTAHGPLGLHIHNDEPAKHIQHLGSRFRLQHAEWESGCLPGVLVEDNGGSPDNVWLSSAAGVAWQLHVHTIPAFDMETGTEVHVVNDNTTPWTKVTNLNQVLTTSAGDSMSGRYFSLIFFVVINQDSGESKLCVNLPSGDYGNSTGLAQDAEKFADTSIPLELKGNAFLLTEAKIRHQVAGGGTWTIVDLVDLRGLQPPITAGGQSTQTSEFSDAIFRIFDEVDETKEMAIDISGLTTGTTRTITMPDADVDLGDVGNMEFFDNLFRLNAVGDATKQVQFDLSAITTGTTRTITVPDGDITLGAGGGTEFASDEFVVQDAADATKELIFDLSAVSTATIRTITMPDADVDLGALGGGGASPTNGAHSLSAVNYYSAAAGNLRGSATGFIASVLCRWNRIPAVSTGYIFSNFTIFAGGGGWGLGVEGDRFKYSIHQVSDSGVLSNFVGAAIPTDIVGRLMMLTLIYDGTDSHFYVNERDEFSHTPASGYLPSDVSDLPMLGRQNNAGAPNPAEDMSILGCGYDESVVAADDYFDFYVACMEAGQFVDGGIGFSNMWSFHGETSGPTTLSDSVGSTDFTEQGTVLTREINPFF